MRKWKREEGEVIVIFMDRICNESSKLNEGTVKIVVSQECVRVFPELLRHVSTPPSHNTKLHPELFNVKKIFTFINILDSFSSEILLTLFRNIWKCTQKYLSTVWSII